MRLLIIGGSDAGISAALRARELAPHVQVTLIVADAFPNYSICGIPFYHSGEVADWQHLAHRTYADLEATGMRLLLNHRAQHIDPAAHTVHVSDPTGQLQTLPYDRLLIATGAEPVRPHIDSLDLPGVFLLHTMGNSLALEQYLTEQQPRSVIIVGSGYIGLEMADALTLRGLDVTLVGRAPTVLPTVDAPFGQQVADELRQHGMTVVTGTTVERIESTGTRLRVSGSPDFAQAADMVLVATGVQPVSELARVAGAALGGHGAIQVNRQMETSLTNIYAAGDCVETWHAMLEQATYLPLGTTAHKQGRIAGENAIGGQRQFAGSLGTQVVKVFDLAIARTGLRDEESTTAGYAPLTVATTAPDHKPYYPDAHDIQLRVTGDRHTGQLLGAQVLGHWQSSIAKRLDVFATALLHRLTIDQLNDLDLSYTPPLGSPWDAVQVAAQAWEQAAASLNVMRMEPAQIDTPADT
jgi:NADPH-dependent 2,4-dienoyl-CoA reductase/sulfur reductase-like enzyme